MDRGVKRPIEGKGQLEVAGLVIAAQRGSVVARQHLFTRHMRLAFSVSLRIVRRREEAEDVAQAALFKAALELHQLSDPAAFQGWLATIATRVAQRRLRQLRAEEELRHGLQNEPSEAFCSLPSDEWVVRGVPLAGLVEEERTAFILRHGACLELGEIAIRMRLSLATVKRRLAAARAKLMLSRSGVALESKGALPSTGGAGLQVISKQTARAIETERGVPGPRLPNGRGRRLDGSENCKQSRAAGQR
jgi:RNA polymerase sigma-70 factor, ECF subfamily